MKNPIELPQAQDPRKSNIKENITLPTSRPQTQTSKQSLSLPTGNSQTQPNIKQSLTLPTGNKQTTDTRQPLTLPTGNAHTTPTIKSELNMPTGQTQSDPNYKEQIQLPAENSGELLTGGIKGLTTPISPVSRELGFLSDCVNIIRQDKTSAGTRTGRTAKGPQVGTTKVLGLTNLYTSTGGKKVIAGSSTALKVLSSGSTSWDSLLTGLTSSQRFEGANFDDTVIITNGTDAVQQYDGSSISALSTAAPISPFIEVAYRRVFLVELPHSLRCSDVADATEWTALDSASVPVNAKDGDEITWIKLYKTNLYIWKRHGLFELHGPELGYVTKNWRIFNAAKVGTPNGRTIVNIEGVLYWLSDSPNSKGIVAWTGGRPTVISESIQDLIDRINWDAINTACAGTDSQGRYLLSVPLDSATTPTSTIVYDTTDGSWWYWDRWVPSVYGSFRFSDSEVPIFGDNDGYVYSMEGTTDAGLDPATIPYEMVLGPSVLGNATQEKRVRKAYIIASKSSTATMNAQTAITTTGAYSTSVSLNVGTDITRVKQHLPITSTSASTSGRDMGGYIYRLKLSGSGVAKVHEVGVEVGIRRV